MADVREIMIVAGEASGDNHAAKLVERLRERDAALEFFGTAGPKMRAAGVESIVNADGLSIVGLAEIATAIPMFWRTFNKLKSEADRRKPLLAILVDFPEFNLKLAKSLKKLGIPVVYYISPQLWAWRRYRVRTIRDSVNLLLTILPFEKKWYQERGVEHVEFVGNPLVNEVAASVDRDEMRRDLGVSPAEKLIALLPGSRRKEIVRILPQMVDAANSMMDRDPSIKFVIAAANSRCAETIQETLVTMKNTVRFRMLVDRTYDIVNAADAAAVTSGTATLETGMIGTPLTVVYRSTVLNYVLLRPLINVEHYGLINLIAGDRIVTELIQYDLTPKTLSDELFRLIDDKTNEQIRHKLKAATESLGTGRASERAADAVMRFISTI